MRKVTVPGGVYQVDTGEDKTGVLSSEQRADDILEELSADCPRRDVVLFHLHMMYKMGYARASGAY